MSAVVFYCEGLGRRWQCDTMARAMDRAKGESEKHPHARFEVYGFDGRTYAAFRDGKRISACPW